MSRHDFTIKAKKIRKPPGMLARAFMISAFWTSCYFLGHGVGKLLNIISPNNREPIKIEQKEKQPVKTFIETPAIRR